MDIETDYLVIGSGAVGMAFVDTMLTETVRVRGLLGMDGRGEGIERF
ncbi:MAG: hypothetical protein AAF331_06090 [Pseudomonadota bacterium]